jgi:arylsulfatase
VVREHLSPERRGGTGAAGQKDPEYTKTLGPRGTFHAWATDKDDPTTDPKFGRVGKQRIEATGMLT